MAVITLLPKEVVNGNDNITGAINGHRNKAGNPNKIPPPPPGFVLVQDQEIPPPPPGFVLVQPGELSGMTSEQLRALQDQKQTQLGFDPLGVKQRTFEEAAGEIGPLGAGVASAGRGLVKIGRALGLSNISDVFAPEPEEQALLFKKLGEQRPISTTVGEALGESAPFAPIAGPISGVARTGVRAALSAGLGAAEGSLIRRGEGAKGEEQLVGAGKGAAIAGTLELLMPVIGRIGRKVIKRVGGKTPKGAVISAEGVPTPELKTALDETGLTVDDLSDAALETIQLEGQALKPEQVARERLLKSEGLTPTQAQITRDKTAFQEQQELAKVSGRVSAALEEQEGILANKFDNAVKGTGGDAVTSGAPVIDHVLNRSTRLDNEISDLYQVARDRSKGAPNVNPEKLVSLLKRMQPSNTAMKGLPKALKGELESIGVIDKDFNMLRNLTVDEAESNIRQFTNQIFNSTSEFGKLGIRKIKNAIDEDVTKSAGEDIFNQARKSKATFEKDLRSARVSKFDTRNKNVVRDLLENKIDADRFLDNTVLSKAVRASDLNEIKRYLKTGTESDKTAGEKAFNDLRAETIAWIKNNSFVGPEDAQGNKALTRAKLESSLNRIGPEKMKVLFDEKERKFFNRVMTISKIREPVRGTALGKGPSAQAIEGVRKLMQDIPLLGNFIETLDVSRRGRVILNSKPEPARQSLLTIRQPRIGGMSGAFAAPGAVSAEEQRQ